MGLIVWKYLKNNNNNNNNRNQQKTGMELAGQTIGMNSSGDGSVGVGVGGGGSVQRVISDNNDTDDIVPPMPTDKPAFTHKGSSLKDKIRKFSNATGITKDNTGEEVAEESDEDIEEMPKTSKQNKTDTKDSVQL